MKRFEISEGRVLLWLSAMMLATTIFLAPGAVAQIEELNYFRKINAVLEEIGPTIIGAEFGPLILLCDGAPFNVGEEWVRCCFGTENTPLLGPGKSKVRLILFSSQFFAMAGKHPVAVLITSMDLRDRFLNFVPGENGTCYLNYPATRPISAKK